MSIPNVHLLFICLSHFTKQYRFLNYLRLTNSHEYANDGLEKKYTLQFCNVNHILLLLNLKYFNTMMSFED